MMHALPIIELFLFAIVINVGEMQSPIGGVAVWCSVLVALSARTVGHRSAVIHPSRIFEFVAILIIHVGDTLGIHK